MTTNLRRWGIHNDYGPLKDVLLGTPEFYRWIDAGPITMRTLNNQEQTGIQFDLQTAMSQHAEMVSIYESNGVTCHYLDADEVLHRNFFARDSSAMSPWGALICHMQLKSRRADYVTAIRFYQSNDIPIWRYATAGHFEGGDFNILEPGFVLIGWNGERSEREGSEQVAAWVREQGWRRWWHPFRGSSCTWTAWWCRSRRSCSWHVSTRWRTGWWRCSGGRGFEFVEVGYAEARNLGVNLVALGNHRVLSMRGATDLNARMRALGSRCTTRTCRCSRSGGGGVHCLCQALYREDA